MSAAGVLSNPQRDFSALTVFAIHSQPTAWGMHQNHYRVVRRQAWQGISQSGLFEQLLALAKLWNPRQVVVDANGVGAGIASFLQKALPGRVIPFQFTAASNTFFDLFDRGLIDREELLRMVYRFAGEVQAQDMYPVDTDDPARQVVGNPGSRTTGSSKVIDPENGEPRGIASL